MIPRTKVFVGSLPPGSKPEELRRLFENYGVVTECDIMNRCGFVHMETQEMAENAIKALNNTNFKGQSISVEPGRMKDRNSGGGGGGGRNQRMGGGGGGGRRDQFDNLGGRNMGGPPRGNFGNQNSQGDMGGMRNSGGPIRRDRGGPRGGGGGGGNGGAPYNRNSGNFDRFQGGPKGGNRDFGMDGRSQNNYNSGSTGNLGLNLGGGGNDRYSGGSFGMGNQDRRGFALPERPMFSENLGNQSRGPMLGGGNSGGGGMGGMSGMRNSGNNQNQGYDRRQQGGFNNGNDLFARRSNSVGGNMNMGNNDMGGRGGYNRNSMGGGGGMGNNNYNQAFPPLGGGGGGYRNGPQRRQ